MLNSKFTAKVDVNQTTVTLIFRNLKDDEQDQDREREFVPKRLGTGMDTKTVNNGNLRKQGEQLQNSTFHEHM